ncbi:hypothetical protein Dvina_18650 [Dactylosporangium vinaceum]|uniref:ABC transporter permease n=1 Tax=Dactylosporangium vinaceum TaxID=53362 RepID=A0ABV5MT16_9ACTN|nr:hypothetical protein [Dactylosporangium vinaceum]UAB99896.1 hypothetical protein Dvina_18650 [Dactylosporangium vinaceum]
MNSNVSTAPDGGALAVARPRLLVLHLISRRVPAALLAFVACGVGLRLAEQLRFIPSSGLASRLVPLTIEALAAVVLATTTRSPFGEPERITGRRVVYLRGAAILVTGAAAVGLLLAGATGTALPLGNWAVLRDTAGLIGLALLCATLFGASFCWTGPLAFLIVAQQALNAAWTTPLLWPARPAHDLGAAVCAAVVLVAGLVVATYAGTREPKSD